MLFVLHSSLLSQILTKLWCYLIRNDIFDKAVHRTKMTHDHNSKKWQAKVKMQNYSSYKVNVGFIYPTN